MLKKEIKINIKPNIIIGPIIILAIKFEIIKVNDIVLKHIAITGKIRTCADIVNIHISFNLSIIFLSLLLILLNIIIIPNVPKYESKSPTSNILYGFSNKIIHNEKLIVVAKSCVLQKTICKRRNIVIITALVAEAVKSITNKYKINKIAVSI